MTGLNTLTISREVKKLPLCFSYIKQVLAVCKVLRIFAHTQTNVKIQPSYLFVGTLYFAQARTDNSFLSQQSYLFESQLLKKRQNLSAVNEKCPSECHSRP